jgi:hypothetical protein
LLAYPTASGNVTLPANVTEIGVAAFQHCTGLISITIPNSVTSIGERAFESCTSLTSITIPASVTSIGNRAFIDCTSLTSVTCLPTTPPTLGYYAFLNTHANLAIKVPSASVDAYKSATNWSNYASRIFAIE